MSQQQTQLFGSDGIQYITAEQLSFCPPGITQLIARPIPTGPVVSTAQYKVIPQNISQTITSSAGVSTQYQMIPQKQHISQTITLTGVSTQYQMAKPTDSTTTSSTAAQIISISVEPNNHGQTTSLAGSSSEPSQTFGYSTIDDDMDNLIEEDDYEDEENLENYEKSYQNVVTSMFILSVYLHGCR